MGGRPEAVRPLIEGQLACASSDSASLTASGFWVSRAERITAEVFCITSGLSVSREALPSVVKVDVVGEAGRSCPHS